MTETDLPKGLIFFPDSKPGISRKRKGKGFMYIDSSGERISDKVEIGRIKALVIPPAWEDVWVCPHPNGYLQATGRDDKNRKQYLYHENWQNYSNNSKFSHVLEFARQLPLLRKRYEKDLKADDWPRSKVLALATALTDELLLRVGNQYYSSHNQTFGLTTLRRKHVKFEKGSAEFNFIGKKGSQRMLELSDSFLINMLEACADLPGYELFRYKEDGGYHTIDSADFNEYINEGVAEEEHIYAKDFRTWGGTVLCVAYEPEATKICEENPRRKKETVLVDLISKRLGNTVSVCRKYYVHPDVLEYCVENHGFSPSAVAKKKYKEYEPEEQMVMEILNKGSKD